MLGTSNVSRFLLHGHWWDLTALCLGSSFHGFSMGFPTIRDRYWSHGPVEIVDLPHWIAWWIFPVRYVNVYQRVYIYIIYTYMYTRFDTNQHRGCLYNVPWADDKQRGFFDHPTTGIFRWDSVRKMMIYPLVNIQRTMENHHAITGKTHVFSTGSWLQ